MFDPRDVAEGVASQHQRTHPQPAADDVVDEEPGVGHFGHPRDERRESADEGNETRRDDGDAAILLVEGVGTVEGAAVEPAAVLPGKDLVADGLADLIVERIAQRRGRPQQ